MTAFTAPSPAQVNPAEIANPRLKAVQTAYFTQIKTLYKQIGETKFPFQFGLGRFVGLDPNQQAESDSRGIEFVYFHDRLILKISGNYNAAYNADRLTQNERASRTFSDVIAPALLLTSRAFPADVDCDGIGFEISFHTRTRSKNFDYEGKEILVVVFDRADFLDFAAATTDSQRQDILNRATVYLDGKEFGLALNEKDPLILESLNRNPVENIRAGSGPSANPPRESRFANPAFLQPTPSPAVQPGAPAPSNGGSPPAMPITGAPAPISQASSIEPSVAPTAAEIDRLQAQFQTSLDALNTVGMEKFHFVSYAPPSFVTYRNQIVLQLTMRNAIQFSRESTSIYKRAAQSFDLFLAGQLKDILDKIPADAPFAGFDITVLEPIERGWPHIVRGR